MLVMHIVGARALLSKRLIGEDKMLSLLRQRSLVQQSVLVIIITAILSYSLLTASELKIIELRTVGLDSLSLLQHFIR